MHEVITFLYKMLHPALDHVSSSARAFHFHCINQNLIQNCFIQITLIPRKLEVIYKSDEAGTPLLCVSRLAAVTRLQLVATLTLYHFVTGGTVLTSFYSHTWNSREITQLTGGHVVTKDFALV